MTVARRFAGITPEVVENVPTGERIEEWPAFSHTFLASRIGAKPDKAGGCGPIPFHTSACAAALESGNGFRSRGRVMRRGDALEGVAK